MAIKFSESHRYTGFSLINKYRFSILQKSAHKESESEEEIEVHDDENELDKEESEDSVPSETDSDEGKCIIYLFFLRIHIYVYVYYYLFKLYKFVDLVTQVNKQSKQRGIKRVENDPIWTTHSGYQKPKKIEMKVK